MLGGKAVCVFAEGFGIKVAIGIAVIDEILICADVEMEPGDALFFHCNLLHRSDQNRSDAPRWSMICCYNAARNDPYKDSRHLRYAPLEKWEDERVREIGRRQWEGVRTGMST